MVRPRLVSRAAFAYLAAAVGLGVGVALTWPLALHLGGSVLDDGTFDAFQFLWNLWWIRESLLELHRLPFSTTHLFHPDGVPLLFHTGAFALGLVTLPLQLLAGVVVAHNVLVVTAPALTLFAVAMLARNATDDPWGALVAGLLAAITPFATWVLPVIYLSCGWIPPAVLALWWTTQRVRRWWLVAASLGLLAFAVFTSQEFAMMAVSLLGIDVVLRLLLHRRGLVPPLWGGGTIVFAALAAVLLGSLMALALANPAQTPPPGQAVLGSGSVVAFLTPPWLATWRYPFIRVFYLGSLTMLLAGAGLLLAPRRAAYWAAAAGLVALTVMGPYLHWSHRFLTDPGQPAPPGGVPGLYLIAGWLVPLLKFLRAPYRWMVALNPLLAILAGIGVAALRARVAVPARRRLVTAALLTLAVAVPTLETRGLRAPLVATTIPPAYQAIARDPTPAALLDLPSGFMRESLALFSSRYMFYQTAHGKFLLEGTVSRLPAGQRFFFERTVDDFSRLPWLKYVVVHRDLLERATDDSRQQSAALAALARAQGQLVAHDGTVDIYQLDTFRAESVHPPRQPHDG